MTSFFDAVERLSDDPILHLPVLFKADSRPEKVNLGIGSYKTAEGKSYLLNSVKKVEEALVLQKTPQDYLPMEGDPRFIQHMIQLNFGKTVETDRILGFQSIGGTAALRLAADFLFRNLTPVIAVSDPTWPAHHVIFERAGLEVLEYPYYENGEIPFSKLLESIKNLPPKSALLLQTACHNPTGADFSKEQWQEILNVVKEGKLIPLLDNAYQGFGESLDADVYPVRLFYQAGIEMIVTVSCSKNFGLYGERVGALLFTVNNAAAKKNVESQVKRIIRSIYSSPPMHGAMIVAEILSQPLLYKEWEEELKNMRERIVQMRENFAAALNSRNGKSTYQFLENRKGFFSFLGLSKDQVMRLRETKGIYMLDNGRINIAGLTPGNLDYVVDSLTSL